MYKVMAAYTCPASRGGGEPRVPGVNTGQRSGRGHGPRCPTGPAAMALPQLCRRRCEQEGGLELGKASSALNPAQGGAAEAQAFLPAMTMLLLEFWQ